MRDKDGTGTATDLPPIIPPPGLLWAKASAQQMYI